MVSSEPAIEALDSRLRRLEFLLTGSTDATPPATGHTDTSIPAQLASLNDRLARIANQHKSIKKLLQACDAQPSLLEPSPPPAAPTIQTLSVPEKLSIILPAAPLYHQVSSGLSSLRDTPFPSESLSAEVAVKVPDVTAAQLRLLGLEEQVRELRMRSVSLLEQWFDVVEGLNGCVGEWDSRLRGVERGVRRREHVREDEETY